MRHDLKWTGDWWGELTPDIASCCSRCRKRNSSVAFSYVSDDCLLFTRVTGDVQDPGSVSALVDSYPAPPDCRTLGTPCDCPPSTWAAAIAHDLPDRAAACELLAGRQLVAAGDSLVRDTWTALRFGCSSSTASTSSCGPGRTTTPLASHARGRCSSCSASSGTWRRAACS